MNFWQVRIYLIIKKTVTTFLRVSITFVLLSSYLLLMTDALIKGITLGLLLSIEVGPILFTIIKQSINNGVRGGSAFVIGVSISDIF